MGQKKKKTAKRTRFQAKTAEVGCVLGTGGDESGKNWLRTDARGRHRMQHKPGKLDRIQTSLSTKNPQTMRFSQDLGTRVLAGAEGLEPSARGFGVDVGTHQRERRRGGVARSPRSSPQRAVLIWCYEESEVEKACRAISFSSPTTISFCLYRATGVGNEITTC